MSKRSLISFLQSLAAVLAGNAAYFLLMPFLPVSARHIPFRIDLGLAVDGCFCVVAWGIIKAVSGRKWLSKLSKSAEFRIPKL